jgi:surfeit locus 1 family protein
MTARLRILLWPAIFSALVVGLLASLSAWQWRRLAWKEALIDRVETRARAEPVALPPRVEWSFLQAADYEFRHVRAAGRYDLEREALVFSKPPPGAGVEPGYQVLTPLVLEEGGTVLVDRGFIPLSQRALDARKREPRGRVEITGLMRAPQSRNLFTPADTPQSGVWYTSDAGAIASALQIADAAPFTLELDPGPPPAPGLPRPHGANVELTNNHLSYAVTWLLLALATVGGFLFYARGRLRAA